MLANIFRRPTCWCNMLCSAQTVPTCWPTLLANNVGQQCWHGLRPALGNVNTSIDILSLDDVDLVTSDIMRRAAEQVKSNKNDPVFTFNSDCTKRTPATLFQHLANIIRIFLIHGHESSLTCCNDRTSSPVTTTDQWL